MKVKSRASFQVFGLTLILCLGLGVSPAAWGKSKIAEPEQQTADPVLFAEGDVYPAIPVDKPAIRLWPIGVDPPDAELTPADGATIYQHEQSGALASAAARIYGEQVDLDFAGNPAPAAITSIEMVIQLGGLGGANVCGVCPGDTDTVHAWVTFEFYDDYVHAGATPNVAQNQFPGTYTFDLGTRTCCSAFQFLFTLSPPLDLSTQGADEEIFYKLTFRTGPLPTDPFDVNWQTTFAGGTPTIGSSFNEAYRDQDLSTVLDLDAGGEPDGGCVSPPTAGGIATCDRRRIATAAIPNTDWRTHIRGNPNPNSIDAGMDLWETPPGSTFDNTPLPAGFFDFSDQGFECAPPGFSSLPYTSGIPLQGQPVATNPPNRLTPTDTIVKRNAPASLPTPGSSATVPIEIVALSLVSLQPITVQYSDGANAFNTQWDVQICLSDNPQSQGSMDITKGQCPGEGGTFSSVLPVLPKLVFRRVIPPPDPNCSSVSFDFGVNGLSPIQFTAPNGHWTSDAPPSLGLIEEPFAGVQVDGNCNGNMDATALPTTSNFHPGVRVPRCPKDTTCNPTTQQPQKRLTEEEAQLAAHGVLPAEQPAEDSDGDGVADPGDNCPFFPNADQADFDDDGVGDVCDTCPLQCDLDQVDSDGDGFGDMCDCAPLDPLNQVPGDPGNMFAQADKRTFVWGPAPNGQDYDVVRGELPALPVGPGFGDEICIEVLTATSVVDSTIPEIGRGFFYIHRSKNHCGPGTWENEFHNDNGYHAPGLFLRHTMTCLPPS